MVENIICGYSMSTVWKFDGIEKTHDACGVESCMKKFLESLRERAQ